MKNLLVLFALLGIFFLNDIKAESNKNKYDNSALIKSISIDGNIKIVNSQNAIIPEHKDEANVLHIDKSIKRIRPKSRFKIRRATWKVRRSLLTFRCHARKARYKRIVRKSRHKRIDRKQISLHSHPAKKE